MAEQEVTIKHGLFHYHEPVMMIINGEEKEQLVERLAFHGDTVKLTRATDIERGNEFGAFYSDEELNALKNPGGAPGGALPSGPTTEEGETSDVADLEDDELVDWLMSTGEFDGQKKPTASEVVSAIGDDADLGNRVLKAEEHASGGSPRKAVVEHVEQLDDGDDEG